MRKTHSVSILLPAIALTTALLIVLSVAVFLTSQPAVAQTPQSYPNSWPSTTQSQSPQPQSTLPDQNAQTTPVAANQTFSGKIVKSGNRLVLSGSSVTYQLDNQQKAHDFLNKTVKVTGVLDSASGTIRVSTIGPA
jgi:hypothetical protein